MTDFRKTPKNNFPTKEYENAWKSFVLDLKVLECLKKLNIPSVERSLVPAQTFVSASLKAKKLEAGEQNVLA